MKRKNYAIALLAALLMTITSPVSASWWDRINGNGKVVEVERDLKDFTSISVGSGLDLILTQGKKEMVKVVADENLHEVITTEVKNGHLRISTKEQINRAKSRKVYVTVVDLTALKASSGSDVVTSSGLKVEALDVDVSSGADVNVEVYADVVKGSASSGSDLNLTGKSREFHGSVSSGADLDASGLTSQVCHAKASSGGDMDVHATKEIYAKASSGGDITYRGEPKMKDISESSGGDVSGR